MTEEADIKSNVIPFPREKFGSPPISLEEIHEKMTEVRESFASDLAEHLWGFIYGEIERAGGDLEKNHKEISYSMMLVVESIKSLYLHTVGTPHPLQDFSKQIFVDGESVDTDELEMLIEEAQKKIEEIQTTIDERISKDTITEEETKVLDNTSKVI